ncbi:putative quinol monooxygenase [Marinobacterium arenosum]|uniref:putative quinol monooxygenase n=1 Tax=Marinobacterium arenosum TaxID=2862496 RepID=UPI001C98050B|nr:putative quinol monooxygenase [Marinobacterium arenosum]MBY4678160.1 antibiotic biosynthesis monooxygenase [Marinobacterium arenosum]
MYCIFIKVELKEGAKAEYLKIISENAAASVRDEPGCHQFDVLEDREAPNLNYLYELYESPAALQTHKETAHYLKDRPRINELIARQTVLRADLVSANPSR